MVKKGYTPEQIINKLRQAEIHLGQEASIAEVSKQIGVTEQTYYRWRKEYGGMRIQQAKRLPGETSKPVEEAKADNAYHQNIIGLGKAGMSGTRTTPKHPEVSSSYRFRRGEVDWADYRTGVSVR